MPIISGSAQLNQFRNTWTGAMMLDLVTEHHGRLLVDWAVGVGKSHNIDETIATAILTKRYDLVIALLPTRQVVDERRWIKNPPSGIRIINLKPRPKALCGEDLDRQWQMFEQNGMGSFGRLELCNICPSNSQCFWPLQYGESMAEAKVVFGTHAHLERSATFIDQAIQWTGASRVLVILDEANFIIKTYRRKIKKKDLDQFLAAVKAYKPKTGKKAHKRWIYLTDLLMSAKTDDLRAEGWNMPPVSLTWTIGIQSCGYDLYGDDFYYLAYDLVSFGNSPFASRERLSNGDISFASVPGMPVDLIIYSGTAEHKFAEYRLGKEFSAPFADYSFQHPDTRWYNIASPLGMKKYFPGNSPQIIDFFANLVARRLQEGKRPLLIAKKCFIKLCAKSMESRLHAMGLPEVKIITYDWQPDILALPFTIPLINYGMIGTNLFQEFDCAYCLTSFYTTEDAINGILQDTLASDFDLPITISTNGHPCRRTAGAKNKPDRVYDVHGFAQYALNILEIDSVLQAVGRVRPYTQPREIIMFQCAEHSQLQYTKEFKTLAEARGYFGITTRRTDLKNQTIQKIMAAKNAGLKQAEAARKLGVSIRTIQRYWK